MQNSEKKAETKVAAAVTTKARAGRGTGAFFSGKRKNSKGASASCESKCSGKCS